LDVNERHLRSEKEGTLLVAGVNQFGNLTLQFLSVFNLFIELLSLEEGIKGRYDIAIDLRDSVLVIDSIDKIDKAHMIRPKSAGRSPLWIANRQKR
jgi:hypothetical protein